MESALLARHLSEKLSIFRISCLKENNLLESFSHTGGKEDTESYCSLGLMLSSELETEDHHEEPS